MNHRRYTITDTEQKKKKSLCVLLSGLSVSQENLFTVTQKAATLAGIATSVFTYLQAIPLGIQVLY